MGTEGWISSPPAPSLSASPEASTCLTQMVKELSEVKLGVDVPGLPPSAEWTTVESEPGGSKRRIRHLYRRDKNWTLDRLTNLFGRETSWNLHTIISHNYSVSQSMLTPDQH